MFKIKVKYKNSIKQIINHKKHNLKPRLCDLNFAEKL